MIPYGDWLELFVPNPTFVALFVGANILLAIYCAYREIKYSRTSQGSIAWLLSLALLPFPTTLLYLMFGLKAFDDYAAAQTDSGRIVRPTHAREMALQDKAANSEWPVLTRVAELPFLDGNRAELLIDGENTFASMFDGISRAKTFVLAQFFIIRDDEIGAEFADRLIERARAGVAVYLLYDDIGCFWLPRRYVRRLREAGVNVARFNQRHRFLRLYGPTRINWRNHRKVVVVDGREAWVGGLNIGREYAGRSPRFGHWRDTHVHVAGPTALACGIVFREDWQWATGTKLDHYAPTSIETPGDQPVLVMPTGPADRLEDCAIAFTEVISRARQRLWIVSPYFVPDVDVQTALYAASLRGVDIRILLPEKADHLMVWLASYAHADRMTDHGISIYRYTGGFLHEKAILVDEAIAGVGTVNFDNRSFNINFEVTLWFTDPKMLGEVEAMLTTDFESARLVTIEERRGRWRVLRFLGQAARLLSPIL